MSVEERHREIARRLWDAASTGDPDPVLQFHPQVIWRSYGSSPSAGTYRGIDEVLHYLSSSGESVEDMHSELVEILVSGLGAILHYRTSARRGPKQLECQFFLWLRIENGVVCEVAAVPWDQAANDAFWRLE